METHDVEWSFPADPHLRVPRRKQPAHDPSDIAPPPATYESGRPPVEYAVALPSSYTPRYAYPVIVWFHDEGGDERDVREWLPRLSPQNYLGLGLRGPLPVADGLPAQRRWSLGCQHLNWLEEQLAVALMETARQFSIHAERIVAAGIGTGATLALQMLLRRPELFAAAACLNADLAPSQPLDNWGRFSGRGLWLGHSRLLHCGPLQPAFASTRLLHAAGLNVCPHPYDDDAWPLETFGRDVDQWLMPTLCGNRVVA
jgi:phospholipase/carboxylesterase